jgi:Tol biopolymer transport system component
LAHRHDRFPTILLLVLGLTFWVGCRASTTSRTREVTVRADGKDVALRTEALTVREALAEVGVSIGADDRIEPDLWVEVRDGMTIRVIRVQEEIIVEREIVPYRQQRIRSEALAAGEQKLLQAGKNGQAEITYRLRFEDGVEVSRAILRRTVVAEPVAQITVVGVEGLLDAVSFEGTMAYLSAGNAWLMRGGSGGRRPVTSAGDLDGHAFDLSPGGSYLLYTVLTETVEFDGPFNDLYLLDVGLVGEEPVRLPIQNVLWAGWSPDGRSVAYSTGVKSGPSGWKASNDLWLVDLLNAEGEFAPREPKLLLHGESPGPYSWWGTEYTWSPDGIKIAYARPDQVGWIDVASRRAFPLASFAPFAQGDDWVWAPQPTWSPDSWFVACTIHVEEPGRDPEASQQFEVWVFDMNQQVRARLTARPVGMWSSPRWSPALEGGSAIAYAEADAPANSYESRYKLYLVDRDGSNKHSIYPAEGEVGIARPVEYRWSRDGTHLVLLYLGDLHTLDLDTDQVQRLTGDGQVTRVDWTE